MESADGVHLSVWEKQGRWMLQIVNGIGERPLRTANACGNLEIALRKETEGRSEEGLYWNITLSV